MMWTIASGVASGIIALAAHTWRKLRARREIDGAGKVIVVTGCDSGIGYNVALGALGWGCCVIATCLDPDGEAPMRLQEAGAVIVKLDLRHLHRDTFKELLSALHSLRQENKELWCLVNNAGVMTYAQCEWQMQEMITSQVEVNLLGLIQVTKILIPTLRRNKGRLVMVSSPTGQVSVPNLSVYCATKWGLEGFSHALRRELMPFGASVVIVRPCNLPNNTGILTHNAVHLKEMLNAAVEETREDFGEEMMKAEELFREVFKGSNQLPHPLDRRLLACFRSAVLSQNPSLTYSAAPFGVVAGLDLLQLLPYKWVDFLVAKNFYNFMLSFARNQ